VLACGGNVMRKTNNLSRGKSMYKVVKKSIFIILLINLMGCMATTCGKAPIQDPSENDVYTFTLYKNQFASLFGDQYMNDKAEEQIQIIMQNHGYQRYEILNSESVNLITNQNTYRVKFFK
jgi:hypothetical protein